MSNTGMLNRLGVIGDVHCASETLERALDALEAMNVEAILCVGDLVDGPGDADATLGLLQTRRVQCVAGNHERWFLDGEQRSLESATLEVSRASRAFIESLPKGRRYATPNGNALLCHGVGEPRAHARRRRRFHDRRPHPPAHDPRVPRTHRDQRRHHSPQGRADVHGGRLRRNARGVLLGCRGKNRRANRRARPPYAWPGRVDLEA
ncbi:MAG: metallophosphoesterase [Deltaproteobacteria bacterium]|nr:metallophosphoesterase [Deltaproteobacteria bacterium]